MMQVLKITGDVDASLDLPDDAEITTIQLNDYMTTEYPEKFDLIVCVHALQTLWSSQVSDAINKLVGDLRDYGELHIHVPAIEHAAKVLLRNETDTLALYYFWGTKDRPFHSGFTLKWLRGLLEESGMIIRKANIGIIEMEINNQKMRLPEHEIAATIIRD